MDLAYFDMFGFPLTMPLVCAYLNAQINDNSLSFWVPWIKVIKNPLIEEGKKLVVFYATNKAFAFLPY